MNQDKNVWIQQTYIRYLKDFDNFLKFKIIIINYIIYFIKTLIIIIIK
jgi:hypothetical protein